MGAAQDRAQGRVAPQHSLRRVALLTDEIRLHKPDLARGHVPAQEPGQAGHLGPEYLDEVAALEGQLFGPGALVVCHCRSQAHGCGKEGTGSVLGKGLRGADAILSRHARSLCGTI